LANTYAFAICVSSGKWKSVLNAAIAKAAFSVTASRGAPSFFQQKYP
jgi:hypothetical protein